jgi:membrane associated rhomboid family serine protease
MNTRRKRSALSYIPGYTNNGVLQLIMASGVAFVILGVSWAIIKIVYEGNDANFNHYFIGNLALPSLQVFKTHWWTLLTYGWFHFNGFWELLSNMLWLYCFGSVVQSLVGHRQVIPLYAYCLLVGGLFYLLAQLLPVSMPQTIGILGARAGLMGMTAAAVTLTPQYRFWLTDRFSIPILVVAGIFAALMIIGSGFFLPVIAMLAGGALMGFWYVKLLKAGYRPGEWMYSFSEKVESLVTPNENASAMRRSNTRSNALNNMYEPKNGISQKRIDDILDKINQRGYNSLSKEEKDVLLRAGKE